MVDEVVAWLWIKWLYVNHSQNTSGLSLVRVVKQAYKYELDRKQPITLFSTLKRHEEQLQQAHGRFLPYKYPHDNILDISDDKLRIYTKAIHDDIWKAKLEVSKKGETYRGFKTQMRYEPLLDILNRKHSQLTI